MDPENDGEEMHCQLWWLSNPTSRFEKIHLQLVGAHLLAGFQDFFHQHGWVSQTNGAQQDSTAMLGWMTHEVRIHSLGSQRLIKEQSPGIVEYKPLLNLATLRSPAKS